MNKKIIFSISIICIFFISKSIAHNYSLAYFHDQSETVGIVTAGIWVDENACRVNVDLVNNTGNVISSFNLKVTAGQGAHPKNNYIITPEFVENIEPIGIGERLSYVFVVDHRELVHCNIQWVYFDIDAIDTNGNEYKIEDARTKVHNPPGKVKRNGYSFSDLEVIIDQTFLVNDEMKNEGESKGKDKGKEKEKNPQEVETKESASDETSELEISNNKTEGSNDSSDSKDTEENQVIKEKQDNQEEQSTEIEEEQGKETEDDPKNNSDVGNEDEKESSEINEEEKVDHQDP
ncbi:hypothetical protein [Sutcliffiella horikoshii]|uniref:Uncharacterized protein n=1 Tax=Sutcliffiella horikoshii TaxID=79883 RepID=A0A5D4TAG2_9BACI|nr:hypothetical protein [Sutcliffiella horikoshii]TYS72279.1 hypothetical protein FZC75_09975 [Sutcliffiella horikoshii]